MSNTPTTTIKTTDVDHGNESEAATSTTPDPLQNSSNSLQTTQNTSNKSFPRESGGTKRKKWMLILIVLIVMSTLAFAGYFFHQNQQPKGQAELIETAVVPEETLQADPTTSDVTEGWEVYQDLEMGFMIKHPEDLKVLMLSQTTEASVEKMFVFENQNKEIIGTLSIDKLNYMYSMRRGENLPQTKILTLDEYMQQNANGDVVNGDLGQCRPSNVGLLQRFLCTTNPYSTEAYIFITKNNQRFIQFSGALKDQVLLDQILSTFEFTDSLISNVTTDWNVYDNGAFSFKYPSHWNHEQNQVVGSNPNVKIYLDTEGFLMNECMKLDSTQEKNNLLVKKFSRVTTGEMCSTTDATPREFWIVQAGNDYGPGISYTYNTNDNPQAEEVFNQILSTFEFAN